MTPSSLRDPRDDEHVPDGSSLMGFLHVLRKGHIALVGREAAHRRFEQVHTRAHARQYIEELMPQLMHERNRRRHAR
jgi:hypothetical protein